MTHEEKESFMAQYWGQNIYIEETLPKLKFYVNTQTIESNGYLELKSLANMSDEDAEELGINVNYEKFNEEALDYITVDLIRQKGYAFGWRQYSVEYLVKKGIVKLV